MKHRIFRVAAGACAIFMANGLIAGEELVKWGADAEALKKEWGSKIEFQEMDGKLCGVVDSKAFITGKSFIPVEAGKKYVLSGTFKSLGTKPSKVYYGFRCYCKDKKEIWSSNSNVVLDSATTLAAECNKGDKKIVIKANKKWKPRYAAAFNVKDDFSDLPNRETSSRIVKITPQGENGETMEVELSKPVNKSYPAGTQVRAHSTGYGTYIYTAICGSLIPAEWKTYTSAASIAEPGKMSHKLLRPGTAFVRIIILPNYSKKSDGKMAFTDLTLKVAE
ncbi:MAG: hypothetical protein WC082_09040 [Victivallales bacterium]